MDLSKNFVFCKEAKITSKMLLHGELFPCIIALKKRLVLELFKIKRHNDISWPTYKLWIENIAVVLTVHQQML